VSSLPVFKITGQNYNNRQPLSSKNRPFPVLDRSLGVIRRSTELFGDDFLSSAGRRPREGLLLSLLGKKWISGKGGVSSLDFVQDENAKRAKILRISDRRAALESPEIQG